VKQAGTSQTEEKQQAREKLKEVKAAYVKACLNVARNALDIPIILYFMNHAFTQT
jgi:Peroxisomal biogenesis factor 11 (PEX11)